MDIEPDCIISSESFDKYEINENRRQLKREWVQEFIDDGLMTQAAVYQRYTYKLSERLSIEYGELPMVENLKAAFRQLCDPETGYLSKTNFIKLMASRLSELNYASEGAAMIFDICLSHAFHPFPILCTESGMPRINEDAFLRAVSLMLLGPAIRFGDKIRPPVHGVVMVVEWGPHEGSCITLRGHDGSDFLRRLFRSLAVPNGTSMGEDILTLSIPRFSWHEPTDNADEYYLGRQHLVVEEEDERSVDIMDVLSQYHTIRTRLEGKPFRESYSVALPILPQYHHTLPELHIPKTRLMTLLKLVGAVQKTRVADLAAEMERAVPGGEITWENFIMLFSDHAELFVDGLAAVFKTMVNPLPPSRVYSNPDAVQSFL